MMYLPLKAVWEITFACNMHCRHCGSRCGCSKPDELSESEALDLCDQMGELGMAAVTLSGGEPLLRPDWDKIAARLTAAGVTPNVLTNGWYIDEEIIDRAMEAGIPNFGISIDGLKKTHDFIRCPGSFDRIMNALELLNKKNIPISIITSISRLNQSQLPQMKELFTRMNVYSWQLQIALPMGNQADYRQWVVRPEHIRKIIDFAYDAANEGNIVIDLGDCLGYYHSKEVEIRKKYASNPESDGLWHGCPAGKLTFGVRCNGDITACNSLRDTDARYIEGNIREKTLSEIWNAPDAFVLNRTMTKDKLSGFCGKCRYGRLCLGGCTSLKETMTGANTYNPYCLYYIAAQQDISEIKKMTDLGLLLELAQNDIQKENYQRAELYLERAHHLKSSDTGILDALGFVHYQLDNPQVCYQMNIESLRLDPENAYAHKGLGIALAALGKVDEGVAALEKAIQLADDDFTDPFHDLAVILLQNNRPHQALEVLEKGRNKSLLFARRTEKLFRQIKKKL